MLSQCYHIIAVRSGYSTKKWDRNNGKHLWYIKLKDSSRKLVLKSGLGVTAPIASWAWLIMMRDKKDTWRGPGWLFFSWKVDRKRYLEFDTLATLSHGWCTIALVSFSAHFPQMQWYTAGRRMCVFLLLYSHISTSLFPTAPAPLTSLYPSFKRKYNQASLSTWTMIGSW